MVRNVNCFENSGMVLTSGKLIIITARELAVNMLVYLITGIHLRVTA